MVLDHILYDLAYVFPNQWFGQGQGSGILYGLYRLSTDFYYTWILRDIAWWIAVFLFVFICGISCSFSHSNLKRGLRLAGIALILTLITYGIDSYLGQENKMIIRFGVLHMLSVSILIYCFIGRFKTGWMVMIGLLAMGAGIYFINFPMQTTIKYLGLVVNSRGGLYSADYFPLLRWFGFFLLGAVLGPVFYPNRKSIFPNRPIGLWERPILYGGRHSLIVYVLHQPIVYLILYLLGRLAL